MATVLRTQARKPVRETLAQATTRVLRAKILDGELTGGEQLRQDALAAEYGISRIPLREALRQLEAEGLVSFSPHKGAVVSPLTLAEIDELFDIRALIEPDLLERAIPHLSADDLDRVEEIIEAEKAAFAQEDKVGRWGELNWKFHSTLYQAAGRPRTMVIIEKVNLRIDRYVRIQLMLSGGTAGAENDHRAILAACRARNSRAAAKLLRRHILQAKSAITQCLNQERIHRGPRRGRARITGEIIPNSPAGNAKDIDRGRYKN